ncbi:MAG: hypothetical protein COA78_23170 [Blastopirellula sp.]|nr:MAG: hypothetical protein COA78_23170 [Blastopirellula sp.]
MYLGIEIGGTKTQVAVGKADGSAPLAIERMDVDPTLGAVGILNQIEAAVFRLLPKYKPTAIGIGFGGPVDCEAGITTKSYQIDGWEQFPLVTWCQKTFDLPTFIQNDCDAAALGEAYFGAGQGSDSVFYVTVGTGVGGGFVCDGKIFGTNRPSVAEIGHLRPGLHADREDLTLESIASGWGIAAEARSRISGDITHSLSLSHRESELDRKANEEFVKDLLNRCDQDLDLLTAKSVAQAAADGNAIAADTLLHATNALGWGIAQVITLLAPQRIVIGGGVSLIGEPLFFVPIRKSVRQYVFGPLEHSYEIAPAALGEQVVLHGAMLIAAGK